MTRHLPFPAAALAALAISVFAFAEVPRGITPDKPDAAAANRSAMESSRGRIELPRGVVNLDKALTLTGKHSGLVFDGNGTTVRGISKAGGYIERGALSVRDTTAYSFFEPRPADAILPAGQVGWLFSPAGDRDFHQGPIQRILPGEKIPAATAADKRGFMRGWRAVPFTPVAAGATSLQIPNGHPFGVGETVLLTDGPLTNELRTEYRQIKATSTTGIELDAKTVRAYKAGAIVGGDWPRDITFRNITFAGDLGPAFIGPAVDLRFEDCTFSRNAAFPSHSGWLSITGCARVSFVRCNIDCGMTITSSHDIHFRDCKFPLLICEQGVRRVTFDKCTVGPGHYFDARVYTTDCSIRGVTFNQTSVGFYDGYDVSDCRVVGADSKVHVRGGQSTIRNLVSEVPITVQAKYQGSPPGAGKGVTLVNIQAPSIHCEAGTSGTITGRTCPVTGDLSGWKITPKLP